MKKWLCLLTLCVLFLGATPLAVKAERLDMGSITCQDFMAMDEEEMAMFMFWLDGYASHANNNTVMDTGAIEKGLEQLAAHCPGNPGDKILSLL